MASITADNESPQQPLAVETALQQALAHHQAGQLQDAERLYQAILQVQPNHPEAKHNLGLLAAQLGPSAQEMDALVAVFSGGHYAEAASRARQMTERFPRHGFGWKALGTALAQMGRHAEALAVMHKAVALVPRDAEVHNNLGRILQGMGRLDEAAASYRQALQWKLDYAEANCNLGNALGQLGRFDEAEACLRWATRFRQDYAEAHSSLGRLLKDLGRLEEAEASCRRALEIDPRFAAAHCILGDTLKHMSRAGEAEACYRQALQINPDDAHAHNNFGVLLQGLGRTDASEVCYRRALQIAPAFAQAHSNLLLCLAHNTVDAAALFAEHRRFAEKFETPFIANRVPHRNSRDPERCLRIGFVSADLREHALAHFFEPVLAHLSGYAQLSLHAYSNHILEDAVTGRMRAHFAQWHCVVGIDDAALAERVRADNIDILVDLSGHTAGNRLLSFARKPAPLQASWIGYLGTTGLDAVDYYLADRFFLPHEIFDGQFTEKIVHLPAFAPFMPAEEAPEINPLPALSNGFLTFGSFNHVSKLSPRVVALWSRLLRALPESRLLVGAMPDNGGDALVDWFAHEGVARDRLSFHPRCAMAAYLALHQQVDLCLDTFPYGGGATSNHAVWMGLPTLTISGGTPASRLGTMLMNHVGLPEFVAADEEGFVETGIHWAKNVDILAEIRSGLRARFERSAMRQPELIAGALQHAFRLMWQRWCDGLPPVALDVIDAQA